MFRLYRLKSGEFDSELLFLNIFVLLFAGGWGWLYYNLPVPPCFFHEWTGLPCLTCGGTRCARALIHGEWGRAFWWNPLLFILAGFAMCTSIYAAIVVLLRLPRIRWHFSDKINRIIRYAVIVSLLLNWIYVLLVVP